MVRLGCCTLLGLILISAGTAAGREWVDASGAFKVEAEFVRVMNDQVELRKADGRTIQVPLAKLSEADRQFINEQQARRTWLADLPEQDVRVGYGQFGKHGDLGYEDRKISFQGEPSPHGLSMHPPVGGEGARVKYELDGKYSVLRGGVAMNDSSQRGCLAPTYFRVLGVQHKAYPAPAESKVPDTIRIELTVDGGDELTLSAHALRVKHLSGEIPTQVAVDDASFDPRAQDTYEVSLSLLASLDLRDVKVAKTKGRGKLTTQASLTELKLTIEDPEPGSDDYVLEIQVGVCGGWFVLWESHPVFHAGDRQDFAIDVRQMDELYLEVHCDQRLPYRSGYEFAHAIWIEPELDTAPPPEGLPLPLPSGAKDRWIVEVRRREFKLRKLVAEGKFADLEAELAQARAAKAYSPFLMVQLFYNAVQQPETAGIDAWEAHLTALTAWRKHSPQSAAPLIALGRAHYVQAWQMRGARYEAQLSAESREEFFAQLSQADDYLRQALECGDADADAYSLRLLIAGDRHASVEEIEQLLSDGMKLDHTCYALYGAAARSLMPGMAAGEDLRAAAKLADQVRTKLGGALGDRAYAEMCLGGAEQQSCRFTREYGFEYAKYQQGIVPVLRDRRFERFAVGIFLELALRHDDLKTAWQIMPHTGWSQFRPETWEQVDTYFAWIRYANRYRPKLDTPHWRAADYNISDLQWTQDGKEIVHIGNYDGRVKAWTIEAGEPPEGGQIYGLTHRGHAAAIDPHKHFAVAGAITTHGFQLRVHDLEEKRELEHLGPSRNDFLLAVSSPDGKKFATTMIDGTLLVADYEHPDEAREIRSGSHAIAMAFSHDGSLLASYHFTGEVVIWNLLDPEEKGKQIKKPDEERVENGAICWSPSGRYLAIANDQGLIHYFDNQLLKTGGIRHQPLSASSIAFTADEKHLILGGRNGEILLLTYALGRIDKRLVGHWSDVRLLRVSPDGKTLASGALDGTIALWDLPKILKAEEK